MSGLLGILDARELVPPLNDEEAELAAKALAAETGMTVYARSIAACEGCVFFLARRGAEKRLCIVSKESGREDFEGELSRCSHGNLKICPLNHVNAEAIRRVLPFAAPKPAGGKLSFGMGDRLGLATPGHIRAIRGMEVTPILAQQSIREMTRTGRTPSEVIDDATWGAVEEGFREGFGADADHLKSEEDIDRTLAAGFRMFTIDPGDDVDNAAGRDEVATLRRKVEEIPWDALETTPDECRRRFTEEAFHVGHEMAISFSEEGFLRAAAKYGRAVARVARLYRYLAEKSGGRAFELEMSVDETDSPTTTEEHFYVAHELRRLGVEFTSLAPRFVGDFEKGVDYKGDLKAFERMFIRHVQIARYFGSYKISIHSGSDKFSVYPIAARHGGELVHVKTAGTSYLEALRAIGRAAPGLFREILGFALGRYEEDRATYHVSAEVGRVARPEDLSDEELGGVLDEDDARQVLHVTYGSVLRAVDGEGRSLFRDRILEALRANEEVHYEMVAAHLRRHVAPFTAG